MSRRGEQRIARRKLKQRREQAAITSSEQTQSDQLASMDRGRGHLAHADVLLIGKALAQEYPIDADKRELIVSELTTCMTSAAQPMTRIAAARALLAADALNLGRERLASEERRPQSVVNVFDRAQVLLQQLATTNPQITRAGNIDDGQQSADSHLAATPSQIAQDTAPSHDPPASEQSAG